MPTKKRRSGGSKARREIRQQSTKNQVVQPGQEGGTYHPLTISEIELLIDHQEDVEDTTTCQEILNSPSEMTQISADSSKTPAFVVVESLPMSIHSYLRNEELKCPNLIDFHVF